MAPSSTKMLSYQISAWLKKLRLGLTWNLIGFWVLSQSSWMSSRVWTIYIKILPVCPRRAKRISCNILNYNTDQSNSKPFSRFVVGRMSCLDSCFNAPSIKKGHKNESCPEDQHILPARVDCVAVMLFRIEDSVIQSYNSFGD